MPVPREQALHFPGDGAATEPSPALPAVPFFTATEEDGRSYDLLSVPIDYQRARDEREPVFVGEQGTLIFTAEPARHTPFAKPVTLATMVRQDVAGRRQAYERALASLLPQRSEPDERAEESEIVDVARLEAERRERRRQQNREAQQRWRKNHPDKHSENVRKWRQKPDVRARQAAAARERYWRQKQDGSPAQHVFDGTSLVE